MYNQQTLGKKIGRCTFIDASAFVGTQCHRVYSYWRDDI